MKKLFLSVLLIFFPLNAMAIQDGDLVLKKNDTYIIFTDERPTQIFVTNPRILEAQHTSDLLNENFQIILKTYSTGASDLLMTTVNGRKYTLKIIVGNDFVQNSDQNIDIWPIDIPPELKKP